MKVLKEWFIEAPWGNIALISWGDPSGAPVLLVHGRQDSVASFIPLLDLLSDRYHYVGIDMPGNGRSDPFPFGVKITRLHFIAAVQVVIEHLKWEKFAYIGHSLGCEQGLFLNVAYPGRISRLVLLDHVPSLQRLQVHDPVEYYGHFYCEYYSNYHHYERDTKLYTRQQAREAVMRARGLTAPQADLILSRNLIQLGDDCYRLSWDRRLVFPAPQNYPVNYYIQLFTKNSPPTLLLSATEPTSNPYFKGKKEALEIVNTLEKNLVNFNIITVQGGHDVHVTNPERLAHHVRKFLDKDFGPLKVESVKNEEFKQYVQDVREFYKSKL